MPPSLDVSQRRCCTPHAPSKGPEFQACQKQPRLGRMTGPWIALRLWPRGEAPAGAACPRTRPLNRHHPSQMTHSEKKKALQANTLLWLLAMGLPAGLHFALAETKFPWPLVLPLLLLGAMLASNRLLTRAIRCPTDDTGPG